MAVIIFMVLLMLPLAQERAYAAPRDVALVSSDAAGAQGNDASNGPSISSDGRYVAFTSKATNLVPGVSGQQVYRKDLRTGEVRLASADSAGIPGNNNSDYPSISSDGRYVAFTSISTNLVPGGTTPGHDFRKDMVTGEVKVVSCDAAGALGNNGSGYPFISSDGRYVAFYSQATNLVPGGTTAGLFRIFRKDLATGEVRLCSADAAGVEGNGACGPFSAISSDGRYVALDSNSTNLISPVTSGIQVFRKDLMTGEVKLCSADAAGIQGNSSSQWPCISCDGRYVAFTSAATNLVAPAITNPQVFRKDLATGEVKLVSADAAGTQGNGHSLRPSISSDGMYVAFTSMSSNLVVPATGPPQVFRKDTVTGEVNLCSASAAGTQGDNTSQWASISSDGRYVAFYSFSSNLVAPATANWQVFRKELAAPYYFYFAEGYTGSGFQEYLCLGNPYGDPADVTATYLFRDGTTKEETYNVPGNSRVTKNVNAIVGPDKEVSIKCESDSPFVAERPMYFDYRGKWTGGHDAVGATSPSLSWYFAEGYTGSGFDEYICVLNPGDTPANLTFRFQTQEEGEKKVEGFSVPAHSRGSFKANQLLENKSYQTSLKLESDHPVVAERPMYFSYSGTGGYGWTGGSCVMGAPSLASSYYFAEGTTRAGFEEWLTLQNPGPTDINIHAVYYLGTGAPVEKDYPVPAAKRSTILVPTEIGTEKDASVYLTSPSPFLAERPCTSTTGAWATGDGRGDTASSGPPPPQESGSSPRATPA